MKRSIHTYTALGMVAATLLFSCKKDANYDVTGDPGVKFFLNNTAAANMPANAMAYSAVNIPDVAGSGWVNLSNTLPASIKLPVFANKEVGQDVTISAVLDTSLVAAYNTANNTSYAVLPDGILNTGNLTARILKGTTTSADSLTITTNVAPVNTLTRSAYMAPIKITTVSEPAAGKITGSTASQIAYVIINTELRRIKYLAVAADAQGALLTGRTSWGLTFSPAPAATTSGSIVDGSNTTYSRWTASPVQVDVNMQATKNVTGLRLYTATSTTYTPTQVEVSVSNDGITYDLVGAPLKANTTYASSYSYILFYKSIQARYIRLKLYYSTSTNSQNFRLGELDVYGN